MTTRNHEFIATFPRRVDNEVRISISRGKRGTVVDMRLWWLPPDADDYLPTKKGITIHLDELSELIETLRAVAEAEAPDDE